MTPRITATVTSSQLDRKVDVMFETMQVASLAAIRAKTEAWLDAFGQAAPQDTNRFVNGFINAARDAGMTSRPLLPILPSRQREQYLNKLIEQVQRFTKSLRADESFMAKYSRDDANAAPRKDGKPRKRRTNQPYFRKVQRRAEKTAKRLERAKEELQKALGDETFVFFDTDAAPQRRQNRALSTVRTGIYGGTGMVIDSGGEVIVQLTNLEPHARIVERNPRNGHPVATAHAIVNTSGRAAVFAAYNDIVTASPMAA